MSTASGMAPAGGLRSTMLPPPSLPLPRLEFRPPGPDGIVYGFLFRLAAGLLAVLVGSVVACLLGFATDWQLPTSLIVTQGMVVGVMVLVAEHFRSRVYERLMAPEEPTGAPKLVRLPGMASLSFSAPDAERSARRTRVVDIVVSVLAIVVLAPYFLLLALLIKLDSSGPVFYATIRLGLNHKPVRLLKFRTMSADAEAFLGRDVERYQRFFARGFKITSDPRITRVGRFMRRYSLDELPKLLNVLRGDLALVGPRPLLPEELKDLPTDLTQLHATLRPGLVSWGSQLYPELSAGDDWKRLIAAEVQFHVGATAWDEWRLIVGTITRLTRGMGAV